MDLKRFNLRVYGVLINEHKHVLVSDEIIRGQSFTKFPGGGLELGEGLRSGLIREFKEETGLQVNVKEHLYTTDFFVPSAFDTDSQVIAVYYMVSCPEWSKIKTMTKPFDFSHGENECFRWVKINDLNAEQALVLPTDKMIQQILDAIKHFV